VSGNLLEQLASVVAALGAGAVTGLALPLALARPAAPPASYLETPADSQVSDALPDYSRKRAPAVTRPGTTQRFDVTFWNIHTRQILPIATDAAPSEAALSRFLRCRVTGSEGDMRPEPFAIATALARAARRRRVHVISGYRSPKFNAHLRKKGHQVAESSYHMTGSALDFRIPGVPTPGMTTELERTHDGGVGRYAHSNFVHVDSGPRRRWRGR
jgi:uncharacterized protein YcbK (DUF882 family)